MQRLVANFAGGTRRVTWRGRDYLVAPATLIVPGVLKGSQGALFYSIEEIRRSTTAWNNIPITVDHPMINGQNVLASESSKQVIGELRNARANGKLTAEVWLDVEATRRADVRILDSLQAGQRIELSTGLFTDNEPAEPGATFENVPYDFIARGYQPDHLAVLPDKIGACSIADGCGLLVNENCKSDCANCPRAVARFIAEHPTNRKGDTMRNRNQGLALPAINWNEEPQGDHRQPIVAGPPPGVRAAPLVANENRDRSQGLALPKLNFTTNAEFVTIVDVDGVTRSVNLDQVTHLTPEGAGVRIHLRDAQEILVDEKQAKKLPGRLKVDTPERGPAPKVKKLSGKATSTANADDAPLALPVMIW